MFDSVKFHNQLALRLGKDLLIGEKRFNIRIDDKRNPTDPWVVIELQGYLLSIGFNASDDPEKEVWGRRITKEQIETINKIGIGHEISTVIDAVHQAYVDANMVF